MIKSIPRENLPEQLNVGRSCVREALQALSLSNIIEIKPCKGAFVSELSIESIMNPAKVHLNVGKQELLDLVNVRLILETAAVRDAVVNASQQDLSKLLDHINNTKRCIKENRTDLYYFEDYEFHKTIFNCTRNKVLINIFDFIFEILVEGIKTTARVPGSKDRGLKWHKQIYKKIKNKDVEGAERALRSHLIQIREDIYRAESLKN
ncbi:MAG: FCD domain-containing protein [Actinomycetota bacterium]|nr:FCD domain-containing protein [Actinomycetota bacterium]